MWAISCVATTSTGQPSLHNSIAKIIHCFEACVDSVFLKFPAISHSFVLKLAAMYLNRETCGIKGVKPQTRGSFDRPKANSKFGWRVDMLMCGTGRAAKCMVVCK